MSEYDKTNEAVNSALARLSNIWESFPEYLRPNAESFKKNLIIGKVPHSYQLPSLYPHLKRDYISVLKKGYTQFKIPDLIYIDYETGIIHIDERMHIASNEVFEDFLAYSVGCSTFGKPKVISAPEYDEEERAVTDKYIDYTCEIPPSQDKTYIVRRGFRRKLYFQDELSGGGKYISDLPPKGGLPNMDQYDNLNTIFPSAFQIITRALLNREGDIKLLTSSLQSGKFYQADISPEYPNLSRVLYLLSHLMEDTPWPVFDALINGNTKESERSLHDALLVDRKEFLLGHLLNALKVDGEIVSNFENKLAMKAYIDKQLEYLKKARQN